MNEGRASVRAFSTIAIILFLVGGAITAYYVLYMQGRQVSLTRLRFRAIAQIGERLQSRFDAIDALRKSPPMGECKAPPSAANFLSLRNYDEEIESALFNYGGHPVYKELAGGDPYLVAEIPESSTCRLRIHLKKMLSASITRDLFDDYALVLLPSTEVLYQHHVETNGRISELTVLLQNPIECPAGKLFGGSPAKNESGHSGEKPRSVPIGRVCVEHQGEGFQIFTQLVPVDGLGSVNGAPEGDTKPTQLLVVGMLRQSRLLSEARGVSSTWLQILAFLLVMAILSTPFLKLRYVGERERLRALDVHIAALAAVVGGGFLTITVVNGYSHRSSSEKLDEDLRLLACKVTTNFRDELDLALTEVCRYTGPAPLEEKTVRYPYFSNLLVVADSGTPCAGFRLCAENDSGEDCKGKAIAPLREVPVLQLGDRQYFIRAKDREKSRLWTLGGKRFAATSLQSRASGEKTAVLAVPYGVSCNGQDVCEGRACAASYGDCQGKVVVLAGQLRSVIDPIVPLGFGFAIINEGGEVLFHSDSGRNREENLFVESDQGDLLRSLTAARLAGFVDASYDGSDRRFYVRELPDIRWFLVTYRDKELWREVHFGVSALAALSFVAYVGFLLLLFFALRMVGVLTKRYRAEWLWPNPDMTLRYAAGALLLFALALTTMAATSFGLSRLNPVVLVVVPPILGIVLARVMLLRPRTVVSSYRSRPFRCAYYALLSALLLVVAVTPAMVAYQDAYAVGMASLLKRREEALAARLRLRSNGEAGRLRCYQNGDQRPDWYETLHVSVGGTGEATDCGLEVRQQNGLDDEDCGSSWTGSNSAGTEDWLCSEEDRVSTPSPADLARGSFARFLLASSGNIGKQIEFFRHSLYRSSNDGSWEWTVDDGTLSYASCGAPEMEAPNYQAVVFRVSGPIGSLQLPRSPFGVLSVLASLLIVFWTACWSVRRASAVDAATEEDDDGVQPTTAPETQNLEELWKKCSQDEQLAIYQLAEEGFINPNRRWITRRLTHSGLIQRLPALRLDPAFRVFVRGALPKETVRDLEQGGRPSVWVELRTPLAALFLLIAGFFLLTQPDVFNSAVGIATALAATLPFILRILSSLGSTKQETEK